MKQEKQEKRLDLGKLATFVPNKQLPVYNWFYFKEGFARDLVNLLLDKYASKDGVGSNGKTSVNVLDPFMGSGTTLVACKERGLDSYGFDVSPLAVLASRAKTNDYDINELKQAIKAMSKSKFQRQDTAALPKDVRKFFNQHTLDDVLFFRGQVGQYSSEGAINDFLKLGLITSTTRCSHMYKDGAVLKVRKKPVPVFRKFYLRTLRNMLRDLQKISFKPCQTFTDHGDARNLRLDTEFIDLVITSPPYLNKIEYTKIYGIEEFLFFGRPFQKRGMRSYIGQDAEVEPVFDDIVLPDAANAYFADMRKTLSELRRVCKPGAVLAFVIGDGCFPEQEKVVHADSLLPRLAISEGFETSQIYTLNERWCTRRRVEKVGKMEESLIILRKE
jgi:DNA modification methylase